MVDVYLVTLVISFGESLSRLYAIRQCQNYPIVFISPNHDAVVKASKRILKAIGINNEILLIKHPTSVKNLIYSAHGSSIDPLLITDEQSSAVSHLSFTNKSGGKKSGYLAAN